MLEVGRVVIGRERGDIILTSFPFQTAHITCQKTGSGSKMSNFLLFYFAQKKRKICLTEFFYRRERGPGPSVTAGVSCFLK